MQRYSTWRSVSLYVLHLFVAFLVILPVLFVLVSSFRPLHEIFKYVSPVTWRTFIPTELTFTAYTNLFALRGFGKYFFNTFYVSIMSVILGVLINSMAAFSFSFFRFQGKSILFFLVLLTFLIPFEIIAIPLYSLVNSFGWIDSYTGLIVPGIANGLVIFLFRQFFLDLPHSLIEAARIDGASWTRIYGSIVMPLCIPVTVTASLLIFIHQWEAFLWPLIATTSKQYRVIQVAMSDFVTEFATFWNEMFAASILAIIVPVIVILWLQRYFVQGISTSGSKE